MCDLIRGHTTIAAAEGGMMEMEMEEGERERERETTEHSSTRAQLTTASMEQSLSTYEL